MNNSQEFVIGIDIGGTYTEFCVVDRLGNFIEKGKLNTISYSSANELLTVVYLKLNNSIESIGKQRFKGIGIGAPAANPLTGMMMPTANINWEGITPLAQIATTIFDLPSTVNNDANVSAIGEIYYGKAIGVKDFIVITLGTGVGSGVVCNGQLVIGHDGFAGELGHWIVDHNGRACGCGRKGCLETYTSATGLVRTALEMISLSSANYPESTLIKLNQQVGRLTAKSIFEAAQQKDTLALDIFNFTGEILGKFFANMVSFTSPQKIILFGGLAQAGDVLLKPIQQSFEDHILYLYKDKTTIEISSLESAEAALLGAAALAWNLNY